MEFSHNIKHLVIFRTGGSILNVHSYNCQEIGLAKALTRRGVKVSVVMAGADEKVERIAVNESFITVYYLAFYSINQAMSLFKNWENTMERINPSHIQIHEFGMWMSYKVMRWANKRKIPLFLIQGSYQTTPKPLFKTLEVLFNKTFGKEIIKGATSIGCKSYRASAYVKSCYDRETNIVYIGLDESKFPQVANDNIKKEIGIEGKKVLLYVGKMEQRRNPLFLLEILRKLPNDYVLLMVGEGPLTDDINTNIKNYHLGNRVYMLGKKNQSELSSIYASSDLFLLASSYEIYGMVIMESMYFGVPVLSSHSGGAEIIIDNHKDGFIEDIFDSNEWVSCILNAFDKTESFNQMRIAAKDKIIKRFVWDKSVDSFLSLYMNE